MAIHKLIYEIKLVCASDHQRRTWSSHLEEIINLEIESLNVQAQKAHLYNSISFKFKGYDNGIEMSNALPDKIKTLESESRNQT